MRADHKKRAAKPNRVTKIMQMQLCKNTAIKFGYLISCAKTASDTFGRGKIKNNQSTVSLDFSHKRVTYGKRLMGKSAVIQIRN